MKPPNPKAPRPSPVPASVVASLGARAGYGGAALGYLLEAERLRAR